MKRFLAWFSPPERDLTGAWQKHHRAAVSRADLLWSLFAAEGQDVERVAALLGFEAQAVKVSHEPSPLAQPELLKPAPAPNQPITPEPAPEVSFHTYPISAEQLQNFTLPEAFRDAQPILLEDHPSRIPDYHQVPPRYLPLTPWSRLLPMLTRCLGAQQDSTRPDMSALVAQVARGKTIQRIPRQHRHTWTSALQLLIDINESNFAYRDDFLYLREQLQSVRGADGLDVQYIDDQPAGNVVRYQNGKRVISAWQAPAQGTPLLILSDLGCHTQSRRTLYQWLAFGQKRLAQGCRPIVLMPVAERDIDSRLLAYFDCIVWDRNSSLKPVRGNAPLDSRDHAEILENFLSLFFAGVRNRIGLVRAVRQQLPSNLYDIGIESALWQHPVVNQDGDEWGWQADSKARYFDRAKTQLAKCSPVQQSQLIDLFAHHHAAYPDELYFETLNTCVLLGLPVPAELKQRTDDFMRDMVATYAAHPENRLLDGWVNRHLARNEGDGIRQVHPYWSLLKKFNLQHEAQRTNAHEVKLPSYLSQKEQDAILDLVGNYAIKNSILSNPTSTLPASIFRLLVPATDLTPQDASFVDICGSRWILVGFSSISDAPPYTCVSYSWGVGREVHLFEAKKQMSDRTIPVLEATIKATQSPENWSRVLSYLSRSELKLEDVLKASQAIWIDELCMPFQSPAREECVRIVGSIFGSASQVIVVFPTLCTKSLHKIHNQEYLKYEELLALENDDWITRAWTYQETANSKMTIYIAQNDVGVFVHEHDFLNAILTDTVDYADEQALERNKLHTKFPNLENFQEMIAEHKLVEFAGRSAYQVMSAMHHRGAELEEDRINAMIGVITDLPCNTENASLHPAEYFMQCCENKSDFSFIYCTAPRSNIIGKGWRPVADKLAPVITGFLASGFGQSGSMKATHLQLDNMCKVYPATIGSVGINAVEKFLQNNVATLSSGEIVDAVLTYLRLRGFSGYGDYIELENGYFFPQLACNNSNDVFIAITQDITWMQGSPGLLLRSNGTDINQFCDVGVFVGRHPKNSESINVG